MEQRLVGDDLVRRMQGTVKWFAPSRGYGFVKHHECNDDILLQENVLMKFGRSSIAADSIIDAFVQQTPRGLQVIEIMGVDASLASAADEFDETPQCDVSNYQPARVKWYDDAKCFGFVNLFRDNTDYFVHERQLRDAGMTELSPGEAIGAIPAEGPRGAIVVAIKAWADLNDH